ncbi:hypothetical protein DPMN_095284 [Dreissena polymorpha]|uniref:Uncharacterized protein n=1 Tax=Dreissena polymorpha TaxID=45954 RepID=A0A9D4R2K9_DREPO|nr:hypothetical protein DPMN_095284 [Dreissena polymorpha]
MYNLYDANADFALIDTFNFRCSTSSGKVSDFVPTSGAAGFLTLFLVGFTDRADIAVSIVCSVRVCLYECDTKNCTAMSDNFYLIEIQIN